MFDSIQYTSPFIEYSKSKYEVIMFSLGGI